MLENKFYSVNTKESFLYYVNQLLKDGFEWVGFDKKPSFSDCKKQIHGNGKLIIHAFYNDITNKKELQFGIKSIYNSYPQCKKIKVINDLADIRKNARIAAKRDGYNQVIIKDNNGLYSFTRKYEGCCPSWYGKIIEEIQ